MRKIFYAHSGGVTSTINSTLVGLVQEAHRHHIEVLIGIHGIHGLLLRQYVSSHTLSVEDLERIQNTPGGSFGSCRYKPKEEDLPVILKNLITDNIEAVCYQGGNDSQLTLLQLSLFLEKNQYPCRILGIPKTIDNDLRETDICPGFGSAAFFLALSMRQLCLDLRSMSQDSTKVYILETMGRHTGWLTAAAAFSHTPSFPGPQMILVPEKTQPLSHILERIKHHVLSDGFCAIAISEGYALDTDHTDQVFIDAFGHRTLHGSAQNLQKKIIHHLGYKTRISLPDYLQRSCAVLRSPKDFQQSLALGQQAIKQLLDQDNCKPSMLTILKSQGPLDWQFALAPLEAVASHEKKLPLDFLTDDGWNLSHHGRQYMLWAMGTECETMLNQFWPHYLSAKSY